MGARQNNVTHTRTFRGTSRVFLQTRNTDQGGVYGMFAFTNSVDAYIGTQFISENYEQYRIKNVKYTMKPSSALLNGGNAPATTTEAIQYQNSVYSLMNNTEVQCYVDYDTNTAPPTYAEILSRPNLKFRALAPNNWTQIANFTPRTLTNPSGGASPTNNFGPNKWMSTTNLSALLHGLRGRVSNRSPLFDATENVCSVDVIVTIQVEMRGPKNDSNNVSAITQLENGQIQRPLRSDDIEMETSEDESPSTRLISSE